MSEKTKEFRPQTQLVRAGLARSQFRETSEALYLNSGFVFESAAQAEAAFKGENDSYIYSRYGNPTVSVFEERLAALEGADMCRATATGMAAVFSSIACQVRAGERVVASRALFGSCHFIVDQILPRWGIETVFVDGTNLEAWEAALNQPTKAVFLESPSNPMLDLVDIPAVAEMAPGWSSTMFSQLRSSRSPSNWVRTSSSIPPPSISTVMAVAWAGRCCLTQTS
jgi:O-succinylhomoserine sulfhydrylase